ncbi:MAG: hypothetical protein QMB89_05175 [Flavobacteriales bacterium]|jgi:hypothetical protein|tara:strand:- start:1460 stop:2068 length:609 start_codon:yes stop_codon:yes gene_type:complete
MKNFLQLLVLYSGLSCFLSGCSDHKTELSLHAAFTELESLEELVREAPLDSINSVRDWLLEAKKDLVWLGSDSNVVFVRSDAMVIEELSKANRYLKDSPNRFAGIFQEIERCKTQVTGLIDVIESGAELDALGDSIDDIYIKRNVEIELDAVLKLEDVVTETLRLARLGLETDFSSREAIDSLLEVKRGQWARGIAKAGEEI